jgi:hypothetical protein
VDYLIDGLTYGFDPLIDPVPQVPLECTNNLSARQSPDVVDEAVASEVLNNYVIGPFESPPFGNYRISPLGVAVGKYSGKKRLILDLSAPHSTKDYSINELIDKEKCSLSYTSIDDATNIIKILGKGTWMSKIDVRAAFKQIPLRRDAWPYFGFKWRNKYYFYVRVAFGLRSACMLFDYLSRAIVWIARNKYKIENILWLLDDFITFDIEETQGYRTRALLTLMFNSLCIPTAHDKTVGPVQVIEFLGILLNSQKMLASLPMTKVERIVLLLQTFLDKKSCTKHELQVLLGHLNFACRVVIPGRSFISYLIELLKAVREPHHHVRITAECRADLALWYQFLLHWNGASVFLDTAVTTDYDLGLYTDAASTIGFGGYLNGRWFAGWWPDNLVLDKNEGLSMAFLELYPIVVAAILWGHEWSQKRVLFHCDNQATVAIIRKGRSKSPLIMKLMRRLTWCAARNNFVVLSTFVSGKSNVISDALSRFQMEKFRQLAPHADDRPHPCPPPSEVMWY